MKQQTPDYDTETIDQAYEACLDLLMNFRDGEPLSKDMQREVAVKLLQNTETNTPTASMYNNALALFREAITHDWQSINSRKSWAYPAQRHPVKITLSTIQEAGYEAGRWTEKGIITCG